VEIADVFFGNPNEGQCGSLQPGALPLRLIKRSPLRMSMQEAVIVQLHSI